MAAGLERVGGLHDGRPDVARRYHEQGNVFARAFSDGYRSGEERLLVVAENLVHREVEFGAAGTGKAGGEYDDILFLDTAVREHPLEMVQACCSRERRPGYCPGGCRPLPVSTLSRCRSWKCSFICCWL